MTPTTSGDGPIIIYVKPDYTAGAEIIGQELPATPFASYWTASVGVVNTSGTAVTWVSGATFSPGLTQLTIAGVLYAVASVNSSTSLTLTTSAGTLTNASYGNIGQASGFSSYLGQIVIAREMQPFNACSNATNQSTPTVTTGWSVGGF